MAENLAHCRLLRNYTVYASPALTKSSNTAQNLVSNMMSHLEECLEDVGVAEGHKYEGEKGGEAAVEDGRPHIGQHLAGPGPTLT